MQGGATPEVCLRGAALESTEVPLPRERKEEFAIVSVFLETCGKCGMFPLKLSWRGCGITRFNLKCTLHCFVLFCFLLVFGKAIHAIARISDEFCFDPLEKGVSKFD